MLFPRKTTINYVIAAWSGNRRTKDKKYHLDKKNYLREHFATLQKLHFAYIAQITIVLPNNVKEPKGFREVIPEQIKGIPVVIVERPNIGLSYGSFSDVYGKYRQRFSHYFFMEDDYVMTRNHFDDIFLSFMQEDVGFVCGLHEREHAAIFLGLINSNALERVWEAHGRLPYADNDKYYPNEMTGQIGQSRAIVEAGYKLMDVLTNYRVGFRMTNMAIRWYGLEGNPTLIKPI